MKFELLQRKLFRFTH